MVLLQTSSQLGGSWRAAFCSWRALLSPLLKAAASVRPARPLLKSSSRRSQHPEATCPIVRGEAGRPRRALLPTLYSRSGHQRRGTNLPGSSCSKFTGRQFGCALPLAAPSRLPRRPVCQPIIPCPVWLGQSVARKAKRPAYCHQTSGPVTNSRKGGKGKGLAANRMSEVKFSLRSKREPTPAVHG